MLVYDMTIKFESTIFINRFDKDFENILSRLGGPINSFGQNAKLEHSINISNSPVLPNDKFIDVIKNNIVEALTETFDKSSSLNAEVVGVEYIGITAITQKEIKENT